MQISIEASAGSGKTYTLAQKYIEILRKNPERLNSIIAITFTNKASIEMKERIISLLKRDNELALLVKIIKDNSDFYVTTIDSFMNRILKAFSVDLKISPDYDVTFDSDKIFEISFKKLLEDEKNHKLFLNLLKNLLYLENPGFDGEKIIKNKLKNFRRANLPEKFNLNLKNFENFKKKTDKILVRLNEISKKIDEIIEKNYEIFNKSKIKKFFQLDKDKIKSNLQVIKNFSHYDIKNLYKKNKSLEKEIEDYFVKLISEIFETYREYVLEKIEFESNHILSSIEKLKKQEEEITSFLNIVDWTKATKKIIEILEKQGPNEAYCRIGEKVKFYLIDEFQDTSKEQFHALVPLIENAISEGGEILVVGDKKQAIYCWRGGDYTVFDEFSEKFYPELRINDKNFRSKKLIVEFNNKIFDIENLKKLKIDEIYLNEIENIYKNSTQIPVKSSGGYVEIIIGENEDSDEFYREKFLSIIKRLIFEKKIPPKDIMVLLRKKENIFKIVSWLREKFPEVGIITEDALFLLGNFEIKKLLLIALMCVNEFDNGIEYMLKEINIKIPDKKKIVEKSKILSPYEFFLYLINENLVDYKNNKIYFEVFLENVLDLMSHQKNLREIIETFYNSDLTLKIPEDIDAIKILTIHKAKGLEAHTVIIPFYDWEIGNKNPEIYELLDFEEKKIFYKIDKDLRNLSLKAENIYKNRKIMDFVEALNLMYVANTRAKNNLFIIGNIKKNRFTPSHIIKSTFKFNGETYSIGEFEAQVSKKDEIFQVKSKNYMSYYADIKNFIKFNPEFEFQIDLKNKKIGNFFHLSISFIKKINHNEKLENVIEKAFLKAKSIIGYEFEIVKELLLKTIIDLKEYFYNIDEVWTEKEFVNSNGEILRIDRLTKKGNNFTIIEFKTGEFENSHILQIKKYLSLIPSANGILYYPKTGKLKYVRNN